MKSWGEGPGDKVSAYCIAGNFPAGNFPCREKTFVNFVDLCSATKVFSVNFWGCGTQHAAAIFGACVLKVPSFVRLINMSLLKYFQTSSSPPKSDGSLSTVVPSSSIVAVNRQAWGEDTRTLTSKCGRYENSPLRRRHGSENRPQSTVWQRQFTTSLTNWLLNESIPCTV